MATTFDLDLAARLAHDLLEDADETSDASSFVWSSGAARQAGEQLEAAIQELRARRAADLSPDEVSALAWVRGFVDLAMVHLEGHYLWKHVAPAFAKLLPEESSR